LNPAVFEASAKKELELERVAGPYDPGNIPVESFRMIPCGLVLKRDNVRKVRVIHYHLAQFSSALMMILRKRFFTHPMRTLDMLQSGPAHLERGACYTN